MKQNIYIVFFSGIPECLYLRENWQHPILERRSTVLLLLLLLLLLRHAQGTTPWILKRGGVESSGRRLISSIGKTKRIVFFR